MSTVVGAPTTTTMVAGQSMYASAATYGAAAPTMTSMYATPGASMYMPAGQASAYGAAYAQPAVVETVAPQAYVTQAPSYVAAPQVVETVVAGPQFAMPQPRSLTEGLVAPAKLEQERLAYEKALEAQLGKQSTAVLEEASIKKKMLDQQAKFQLEQYQLQIDENLKMGCLQVDQEAQTMLIGLKEAAITQQTAREEMAAIAVADYKKKEALGEMAKKSYELQKQWFESETKLTAEYQKVMQAGAKAIQPAAPVQYAAQSYAAPVQYASQSYAAPVQYASQAYAAPMTTIVQ